MLAIPLPQKNVFPQQNKRKPLPPAKSFTVPFLHQEISDKRIHYQGLTLTRHQRSHLNQCATSLPPFLSICIAKR